MFGGTLCLRGGWLQKTNAGDSIKEGDGAERSGQNQ